jgi:hypothetical protein
LVVYKNYRLTNELRSLKTEYSRKCESEKQLLSMLKTDNEITGKKLVISDIPLLEALADEKKSPILLVGKDVCSVCKDDLFLQFDKLQKDSLEIFNN